MRAALEILAWLVPVLIVGGIALREWLLLRRKPESPPQIDTLTPRRPLIFWADR